MSCSATLAAQHNEPLVAGSDGSWLMDGDLHLDEVERAIGYGLPRVDEAETVAGMLIAELGALPAEGDLVTITLPVTPSDRVADKLVLRQLEVNVLQVERYVPTQVRARLIEVVKDDS